MSTTERLMLVTGGSSGIGLACAELALESGWQVLTIGRRKPELADRPEVTFEPVDLSDAGSRDSWVAGVLQRGIRFDGAILSAGDQQLEVEGWDEAVWRHTLEINLMAPAHVLIALHPAWNENAGLVLIGSNSAEDGCFADLGNGRLIGSAAYAASKAALIGLARTLILQGWRQRINVLQPGGTATPMAERLLGYPPTGSGFLTPSEVAEIAMMLVTSRALNGVALRADQGARAGDQGSDDEQQTPGGPAPAHVEPPRQG